MKVLSAVKHLLLVALLVNGLALAACDSSSGGSSDTVVDNPDGGGTGDTTCQPNCTNRECGEDPVCGESCGICEGTAVCVEGQCVDCVQNCTGLECGDDPVCGQSCGECTGTDTCVEGVCLGVCDNDGCGDRQCGPAPNCDGYFCGDNGGDCLTGECTADGMCECVPSCVGKDCGDDGCGGSCGTCEDGYECTDAGVCREEGLHRGLRVLRLVRLRERLPVRPEPAAVLDRVRQRAASGGPRGQERLRRLPDERVWSLHRQRLPQRLHRVAVHGRVPGMPADLRLRHRHLRRLVQLRQLLPRLRHEPGRLLRVPGGLQPQLQPPGHARRQRHPGLPERPVPLHPR